MPKPKVIKSFKELDDPKVLDNLKVVEKIGTFESARDYVHDVFVSLGIRPPRVSREQFDLIMYSVRSIAPKPKYRRRRSGRVFHAF